MVFAFLRLKSHRDPVGFPFDTQWKDCHPHYWQGAQTDHAHAFGRGGSNDHDNLVSTSGTNNELEGDRAADALGWTLQPRGVGTWDGGLRDFVAAVDSDPALRTLGWVKRWYRPAKAASRFSSEPHPSGLTRETPHARRRRRFGFRNSADRRWRADSYD
jgi:hypothetical protein